MRRPVLQPPLPYGRSRPHTPRLSRSPAVSSAARGRHTTAAGELPRLGQKVCLLAEFSEGDADVGLKVLPPPAELF